MSSSAVSSVSLGASVEALRKKVLDAAVRGELTEQRAEDGTAADLLKEIAAEKAALAAAGKLKKENPLPAITEEEIPFEIPENWEWVRITDIAKCELGKTKDSGKNTGEYFDYLCSINVYDGDIDLSNIKQMRFEPEEFERFQIKKGDLLVCEGGDAGRCAVWDKEFSIFYQNALHRIRFYKNLNPYFYMYLLHIYKANNILSSASIGVTIQHLTLNALKKLCFPLPPLAEQRRIVEKVNSIFHQLDELKTLQTAYASNLEALRKKVIEEGVRGNLTEHLADDGTAADLLKEIAAERAALVAAGKMKKEKPLPGISEEEKPFEIPESWEWVRLRELVYNRGQKTPDKRFSYIDIGSIDNLHQKLNAEENLIEAKDAPSRARKIVSYGDILYATVRPYLHNACIIDKQFSEEPIASTGFAALTCYRGVFNKYLLYYLLSPGFDSYANDTENSKGVVYPAINDDKLYKAVIPLPPLAEQRRIVAKVDELLKIIDVI